MSFTLTSFTQACTKVGADVLAKFTTDDKAFKKASLEVDGELVALMACPSPTQDDIEKKFGPRFSIDSDTVSPGPHLLTEITTDSGTRGQAKCFNCIKCGLIITYFRYMDKASQNDVMERLYMSSRENARRAANGYYLLTDSNVIIYIPDGPEVTKMLMRQAGFI